MKTITLILLVVSSMTFYGQGTKQIASRKIKAVETKTFEIRKDIPTYKSTYTEYNRQGQVLVMKEFDNDSICVSKETFQYNKKGEITEHKIFNGDRDDFIEMTEIHYDRWGRDTLKITFDESRVKSRIRYSYNTMDEKTEEVMYDADGNLMRRTEFTYDKKGMLLSKKSYTALGEMIYQKSNLYTY